MGDGVGLPVSDDDIRRAVEDRANQLGDVAPGILVVPIGIDDDVGTERQGSFDTAAKGSCQALVVLMLDDVIDADLKGERHGAVGRAIVDDEDFDLVYPLDPSRYVRDGLAQRGFLIVARDLYDQLHIGFEKAVPRSERMLTGEG